LAKSSRNEILINNLGVLATKKDYRIAIEDFELAKSIRKSADVCNNLGYLNLQIANFKGAISEFLESLALEHNFEAYNGLGIAHTALKQYRTAGYYFELAAVYNEQKIILNNTGNFYCEFNPQKASAFFDEGIELDPSEAYFYNGLARLKYNSRHVNAAIEIY
jgi:tetratricopeptide (TPR) repeat protein